MSAAGVEEVSAREAEVLDAVGDHLTNAQIAQRLHISVRTVESHVSSLLRKLGAADRRELAAHVAAGVSTTPLEFSGLPSRWTSFIGRATEIDEIIGALGTSRLVTLLGPGGIGKTTLATVVAERLSPAFGAFVDLVPVSSGFVVQAVAAALGGRPRHQS
jgi:DNA-binding CsgD family transcriptional regulator